MVSGVSEFGQQNFSFHLRVSTFADPGWQKSKGWGPRLIFNHDLLCWVSSQRRGLNLDYKLFPDRWIHTWSFGPRPHCKRVVNILYVLWKHVHSTRTISRVSYRRSAVLTICSGFRILNRWMNRSAYVSTYLRVLRTYDNTYTASNVTAVSMGWWWVFARERTQVPCIRLRANCLIYIILVSFIESEIILPILQMRKWIKRLSSLPEHI